MLYIVGTPIGNIEDTSLRAVRVLTSVDIILTEDTRSFGLYYQRIRELFAVDSLREQEIRSYHDQNEFQMLSVVLEDLAMGKRIALVSEAGMPLVSDPGLMLVQHAIKNDIPMTVVPGPTAYIAAGVLSGFDLGKLFFIGYMPKKDSERKKLLTSLQNDNLKDTTIAFYESPHRIQKTLMLINNFAPDADIVIARELTKKFEEVVRGKPAELVSKSYKGELTVLLKF